MWWYTSEKRCLKLICAFECLERLELRTRGLLGTTFLELIFIFSPPTLTLVIHHYLFHPSFRYTYRTHRSTDTHTHTYTGSMRVFSCFRVRVPVSLWQGVFVGFQWARKLRHHSREVVCESGHSQIFGTFWRWMKQHETATFIHFKPELFNAKQVNQVLLDNPQQKHATRTTRLFMHYIHTLCPLLLVGHLELNLTRAGCWLISSLGDGEESKRVPVEGPVVFFSGFMSGFKHILCRFTKLDCHQ